MDRLSKNILFCLFDGEVAAIDIYLKPESMHFGVYADQSSPTTFHKGIRKPAGSVGAPIAFQVDDSRVINILELANILGTVNSAEFAFQMIEVVERVRFNLDQ